MSSKSGESGIRRNADSKPVSFRIYGDLVEHIDKIISSTELYMNKPDFFIYAMRTYYQYNIVKYATTAATLRSIMKDDSEKAQMLIGEQSLVDVIKNVIINVDIPKYDSYKSEAKTILVRIPLGFFKMITDYIIVTGFYKNIQDFCRKALMFALYNDRINEGVASSIEDKALDPLRLYAEDIISNIDWQNYTPIVPEDNFKEPTERADWIRSKMD